MAKTKRCRIYYTSDTHGYFAPVDYASGKPAPTGLANCMAGFEPDGNTLVLDGGDTIQGSPALYRLYRSGEWRPDAAGHFAPNVAAQMMNLAGYQYVTLGNHDFNYGPLWLESYLSQLHAACLCANIEGVPHVEKRALVTLENGLRVGITGITTSFITLWEKPENLVGVTISDPFAAAKKQLELLKSEGAQLTVCIYHGGYEENLDTGEVLSDSGEDIACKLCRELCFDVLLTGHQHQAVAGRRLGNSWTCQMQDRAAQYIVLDAEISQSAADITSRLVPAGDHTPFAAGAILAGPEKATKAWLDTPVSHLDTALLPESHIEMAAHGSLIANFINQVQREATGAELSVTSLGNIIKGFAKEVTVRDVVASYPFPNTLVVRQVNRAVLRRALERSAEYYARDTKGALTVSEHFLRPKEEHYNFDYIAGIEVLIDPDAPLGHRVLSIRRHGEELPEDKILTLCMNNYRSSGTGGYAFYTACPIVQAGQTEVVDLLLDYLSNHAEITVDKTQWVHLTHA